MHFMYARSSIDTLLHSCAFIAKLWVSGTLSGFQITHPSPMFVQDPEVHLLPFFSWEGKLNIQMLERRHSMSYAEAKTRSEFWYIHAM